MTAQEAAQFVNNGDTLGFSGFTHAGVPKVVPAALAERAHAEHEAGREFRVNVFTGASTNPWLDDALAAEKAINRRMPYQSTKGVRAAINALEVNYADLHLSEMAQMTRYNFFGKVDTVIIEAQDLNEKGEIVLGTGVGNVETYANMASKIIVEINHTLSPGMRGLHDIYMPLDPPYRREIPIYKPSDRIGHELLKVDPKKIIAVVDSHNFGDVHAFTAIDESTAQIGHNVCDFLARELREGRLPKEFLPLQSGVGNIANAVLAGLAESKEIPPVQMYTEVVQDMVLDLMKKGRCTFASTCSLSLSNDALKAFFDDIDFYRDKLILRPAELSNNPEVIRRLGVISMNTALEADIYGNINSTHVLGTKMMNGIGGSGDFTRNAYVSIFSCPSITKGGAISNIVPMVSHVDHSEHSVDIIITEQGVADLRGLSPVERTAKIIDNCAHPMYRDLLREYVRLANGVNHTPHALGAALAFHREFLASGNMANTDFNRYI